MGVVVSPNRYASRAATRTARNNSGHRNNLIQCVVLRQGGVRDAWEPSGKYCESGEIQLQLQYIIRGTRLTSERVLYSTVVQYKIASPCLGSSTSLMI